MFKDIKNYFANFNGTTNACRTVALWVVLAFAVAFIASKIYAFVIFKKKGYSDEQTALINKTLNGGWIAAALTLSVALIVTFASCYFVEVSRGDDSLNPILFYPLLVLAVAAVASAIAIAVKPSKLTKIICASVCGAALVAVIVCMIVYYASGDAGKAFSNIGLYISAIGVAAAIIAVAMVADKSKRPFDTRTVAFGAVCVALSFALSYVRIFKMPMGGSITLASMLPLMLFAFMFGSRKGILVGALYGILQAVQDPWIIHPAQFVLDYVAAFAAIGLTGCLRDFGAFKNNIRAQFFVGAIVACALRFVSHYFAGVFAFGSYGAFYADSYGIPLLSSAYFYSFVYQCLYIIPELIIVIAVGLLAFASKNFRRQIEIYSAYKPATVKQTVTESVTEAAAEELSEAVAAQSETDGNSHTDLQ